MRALVSRFARYGDCGTDRAVPMRPMNPAIERSCMKTLLLKKDEVRQLERFPD